MSERDRLLALLSVRALSNALNEHVRSGRRAPEMLVVDAANVVGSRPNGWWRDRAKAAANLCAALADAIESDQLTPPVAVVLEGAARDGAAQSDEGDLRITHAPRGGDDAIVDVVARARSDGHDVTLVTADRELRDRVAQLGCEVVGPRWLLEKLEQTA